MSRVQFWAQITILTNRLKFHVLDDIALRIDNSDLEPESGYEHAESTVGLVCMVETHLLNFLWVWYWFDIRKKKIEKC